MVGEEYFGKSGAAAKLASSLNLPPFTTHEDRELYTADMLQKLFNLTSAQHSALYGFFLTAGMTDKKTDKYQQEVNKAYENLTLAFGGEEALKNFLTQVGNNVFVNYSDSKDEANDLSRVMIGLIKRLDEVAGVKNIPSAFGWTVDITKEGSADKNWKTVIPANRINYYEENMKGFFHDSARNKYVNGEEQDRYQYSFTTIPIPAKEDMKDIVEKKVQGNDDTHLYGDNKTSAW